MKTRHSLGERSFDVLNIVLMCVLMIITLYPMLHVLFGSFSEGKELMKHEGLLFHVLGKPTLSGYRIILKNKNIWRGFCNSVGYVFGGTALNLLLTSLLAYALSRRHFAPRKLLMKLILVTMFFSGGIIPLFLVIRLLGLFDSPLAVILPGAISTYNMVIMRTFFMRIPNELEESAQIDGANDFVVYSRIVLPMSMAVIAVIALYYGVGHWNAWFNAMVFLRNRNYYPLQLFLREILIESNMTLASDNSMDFVQTNYAEQLVKYCLIVVSTVPILVLYPFLQKYFVKGVMIGALKG